MLSVVEMPSFANYLRQNRQESGNTLSGQNRLGLTGGVCLFVVRKLAPGGAVGALGLPLSVDKDSLTAGAPPAPFVLVSPQSRIALGVLKMFATPGAFVYVGGSCTAGNSGTG